MRSQVPGALAENIQYKIGNMLSGGYYPLEFCLYTVLTGRVPSRLPADPHAYPSLHV